MLDFQIKNTYDEFYSKETFEIPKINVIDLSRDLLISKETTRRKILELERDGVIKKDKKKILINRKGQEYQKPKDSIKSMARLMSRFTDFLTKSNLLDIGAGPLVKSCMINLLESYLSKV